MIQIYGREIVEAVRALEDKLQYISDIKNKEPAAIIENNSAETIGAAMISVEIICEKLNLFNLKREIQLFRELLKRARRNASEIYTDIKRFYFQFKVELSNIGFVFISKEKSKYFEQDALFGENVFSKLESVRVEIKNAGSCLSAGLNTAAVFHLMRVVNIGLRELAWSLGIKKISGKKLEYCRDDTIIKEIEKAIDGRLESVDKIKRGEKWEIEKTFYQGLLVDLHYFKDAVRDPVAHARKSYSENGALDVYAHVKDFIQRLAGGLSKKKKRQKGLKTINIFPQFDSATMASLARALHGISPNLNMLKPPSKLIGKPVPPEKNE